MAVDPYTTYVVVQAAAPSAAPVVGGLVGGTVGIASGALGKLYALLGKILGAPFAAASAASQAALQRGVDQQLAQQRAQRQANAARAQQQSGGNDLLDRLRQIQRIQSLFNQQQQPQQPQPQPQLIRRQPRALPAPSLMGATFDPAYLRLFMLLSQLSGGAPLAFRPGRAFPTVTV